MKDNKSSLRICDLFAKFLGLFLTLLFLKLPLIVGRGDLVLLVLGYQVVHVALSLSELHLIHALARVPVQEGLAPEHGHELL